MDRKIAGKSKRIDKRRVELNEWKKQKKEAKELMKKMTKPPFKPVGKATLLNKDKSYVDPFLQKSTIRKTRLQSTMFNKTSNKVTSTPFVKAPNYDLPKPFIKNSPAKSARRNTFDKEKSLLSPPSKKFPSFREKKSAVHFKDQVEEIITITSPSFDKNSKLDQNLEDEIRRTSNAGRTPFSCTESRSGSTPGRKDCPSSLTNNVSLNDTLNNILDNKRVITNEQSGTKSNSKKNRSRTRDPSLPRWSVSRKLIMEREPYLLRERTPSRTPKSILNNITNRKNNKGWNSSTKKESNEAKGKYHVSYGDVKINTIEVDESIQKSPTFDNTNCLRFNPAINSLNLSKDVFDHQHSSSLFATSNQQE